MTLLEPELSPLAAVEDAVQLHAKDLQLDVGEPGADRQLRELIDAEIDRWSVDFRRGIRPFDLSDPDVVAERAYRNITGYGPLAPLLADDDVWEIMVNGPDAIFVKRHKGQSGYHHESFHDDAHIERTLTKVLNDASGSHRKLDPSEGLQDAQLDSGARLHIVHRDIANGGHLMVNIRKFTGVAYRRLNQLIDSGSMTPAVAAFLTECVKARQTIVFAGAPGSGKTTLLSCCAAELDPTLRVVVAEEVFEADIPLPNVASMQTRAPRADRPGVDLRKLVAGFLRMAPDIAIVGEVRDQEALPLLLTLSSGVKGYTTIHAGSARQALSRLRFIAQLAETSNEIPMSALNNLVSEAIDVVVHCIRTPDGPVVNEVVCVEDQAGGPEATSFTVTEVFARSASNGSLTWSGALPQRVGDALIAAGANVRHLLDVDSSAHS